MAGLGGKNWTFEEEVTSSDVNGYLADQVIMRFADASSRTAGFGGAGKPTLAEGMVSTLDSTENIERYSGASWVPVNPVGVVSAFAGTTAPDGWLLCAGQNVSRTTYSALFAVIGTAYSAGDGSTTFALPDLRGRVVAGLDNMGGSDAGRLNYSNTIGTTGGSQTNTHNHYQSVGFDGSTVYVGLFSNQPRSKVVTNSRTGLSGSTASSAGRFDSTDDEAIDIMQPTMVLNYIIKAL